MTGNEMNYYSFLLRIWHINNHRRMDRRSNWVCELESIQSGETWKVKGLEGLFVLLRDLSGRSENSSAQEDSN